MDKTIALYMRLSDEDDNLAAHEESSQVVIFIVTVFPISES